MRTPGTDRPRQDEKSGAGCSRVLGLRPCVLEHGSHMTRDERRLLIFTASGLAELLAERAADRGTTSNLAEQMYTLINRIQDETPVEGL